MAATQRTKWFLPPSLNLVYQKFCSLFTTLYSKTSGTTKKLPLMIIGPPGVGKTLFSETFKELYQKEYGVPCYKMKRINIAAIPKELLASELFGYLKGSFTGAMKDYDGLVKDLEGGILIMDEIGELPEDVQAKLLTFIEDGYYYRLGDKEVKKSKNLQIIASTNKTLNNKVFRQDFFDRLFPLYLTPLHTRRRDILYYWAYLFPDIIQELNTWEVMALLAYNWPGNVREIERVGNFVRWQKEHAGNRGRPYLTDYSLFGLSSGYTLLDSKASQRLYEELHSSGIDVNCLENVLRKNYGIGLTNKGKRRKSFPNFDVRNLSTRKISTGNVDIMTYAECDPIENSFEGLTTYCCLFRQDIRADKNLLDLEQGQFSDIMGEPSIPNSNVKHTLLESNINHFIEQKKAAKLEPQITTDISNISRMTEKQYVGHYQSFYLKQVLIQHGGNQTAAARHAGLHLNTFRDHCKLYGIL